MDKVQWCAATAAALVWGWWATRFGSNRPSVRLRNRPPTRIDGRWTAACFATMLATTLAASELLALLPVPPEMTADERSGFHLLVLNITAHFWTAAGVTLLLMCNGIRAFEFGLHFARLRRGVPVALQYLFGWLPAVYLLNGGVRFIFPQEKEHPLAHILRDGANPMLTILAVVAAVVTAPAAEELLFRGVLQSWLTRRLGALRGIALTATAFGALHYAAWPDPLPLIAAGVLFGVVYQKTRSLFCSTLTHSLFNGVTVVIALLQGKAL